MKKINTRTHLSTKHLKTVKVDTQRLYSETIEEDDEGNIILHKSFTTNMSSGYGEESEYYILSPEECQKYGIRKNKH